MAGVPVRARRWLPAPPRADGSPASRSANRCRIRSRSKANRRTRRRARRHPRYADRRQPARRAAAATTSRPCRFSEGPLWHRVGRAVDRRLLRHRGRPRIASPTSWRASNRPSCCSRRTSATRRRRTCRRRKHAGSPTAPATTSAADGGARLLQEHFSVIDPRAASASTTAPLAVGACAGALLAYLQETQQGALPNLRRLEAVARRGVPRTGPHDPPEPRTRADDARRRRHAAAVDPRPLRHADGRAPPARTGCCRRWPSSGAIQERQDAVAETPLGLANCGSVRYAFAPVAGARPRTPVVARRVRPRQRPRPGRTAPESRTAAAVLKRALRRPAQSALLRRSSAKPLDPLPELNQGDCGEATRRRAADDHQGRWPDRVAATTRNSTSCATSPRTAPNGWRATSSGWSRRPASRR